MNNNNEKYSKALSDKFGELPSDLIDDLVDDGIRGEMSEDALLSFAEKKVSLFQQEQEKQQKLKDREKELKSLLDDNDKGISYKDRISEYRSKFEEDGVNPDEVSPRILSSMIKAFDETKKEKPKYKFNPSYTPNASSAMMSDTKSPMQIKTKSFQDMMNENIADIKNNGLTTSKRFNSYADHKMAQMVEKILQSK